MNLSTNKDDTKETEFVETLNILKQAVLFSRAPLEALKLLALVCQRQVYEPKDIIFNQDEDDGAAYLIIEGTALLVLEKDKKRYEIREYGPDAFLGGFSLMAPMIKPFSLKALESGSVTCLVITRKGFTKVADQFPEILQTTGNALVKRTLEADKKIIQEFTGSAPPDVRNILGISLI